MPVRYKLLTDGTKNDLRWEHSLNMILTPGCFMVEIDHTNKDVGLPVEYCGSEHYIVGTLIVTDSGTAGVAQKDRAMGQILMFTNRESKSTKVYCRTLVDAKWSEWRSLVETGMFNNISSTEELVATVEELRKVSKEMQANLFSEATRATLAETILQYRNVGIEYTGNDADSVLKDSLKLLRIETDNPDVNALDFRVTRLFKNYNKYVCYFGLTTSSGNEVTITSTENNLFDGDIHSIERNIKIDNITYRYKIVFAIDGNSINNDGVVFEHSYNSSPYTVSNSAITNGEYAIQLAKSEIEAEITESEISDSFIQVAEATPNQILYHSILKNIRVDIIDETNSKKIDTSTIALQLIRKRTAGTELWWSAISSTSGNRIAIVRDNVTPLDEINTIGYTHFEFTRSTYGLKLSYDADFNKIATGLSEYVYGSADAAPSFVVSKSHIFTVSTSTSGGNYRENIKGGQIESFVPENFGIVMQNDPTAFDIKTPYLITDNTVMSVFLEIGDAGAKGSRIGGLSLRLNFWLFRNGFIYYPPKVIYGVPVNVPQIPIRLASDSSGYVHIILGRDNVKWSDLGLSINTFINIDKVYVSKGLARKEGWSISNITAIDSTYENVTEVTPLMASPTNTNTGLLSDVLPIKPASFAVFGSSKSTTRTLNKNTGWIGKLLHGLFKRAGLVDSFTAKTSPQNGLSTDRRFYSNIGRKITGVGNFIEFDTYGNNLAVIQTIARTTDYGVFNVYADNVLIGTFDNRNNTLKGKKTVSFEGNGTQRSFFIPDLCSYNFSVKVGGVEKSVTMNPANLGNGTYDCYAVRTIMQNAGGEVQRILYFPNAPTGTIEVTYDVGDIIAYSISDYHTTTSSADENTSPVYISDVNSVASFQSGYPLMPMLCDERSVVRFNFGTYAKRRIKIEIVDGVNPYFDFDFAVAEYNILMNAAFGGYDVPRVNNEPRWRDWRCLRYFINPDKLFMEYGTNDDRYEIDRVLVSTKEMTLAELKDVKMKLVKTISKSNGKVLVGMCTGVITNITPFSLVSEDIKTSDIEVGDYVRLGEYHSSWREFVVRRITAVDKQEGQISWDIPFNVASVWRYNSLDEMVGAQFAVRRLGQFKTNMRMAITKMQSVLPATEIYLVGMSAFRDNAYCSGWGYNEAMQDLAKELSCKFINISNEQTRYDEAALVDCTEIAILSEGVTKYTIDKSLFTNQNREMRVLVNGVDVTGISAYIEINSGWHVNDIATVDEVELTTSQDWNRVTQFASQVSRDVDVVFYKDTPSVSDEIKIVCANTGWSDDGTHQTADGNITYSDSIIKVL